MATATLARPAPAPAPAQAPAVQVGDLAPAVSLPDLDGNTVDLAQFKGDKTLMVFWNPGCGFCKRMTEDIKAWEANPPADAPKLLLVSTGAVEANREHGFTSTMVLDQGFSTGRQFGASGTPSAILIDKDGKIASRVAVGAPGVLALANNEDPATSRPAGPTGAEEARHRRTSPCRQAPRRRWQAGHSSRQPGHQDPRPLLEPGLRLLRPDARRPEGLGGKPPKGAPKLLVVSTGSVEDNRAMGLRSPVLLDQGFSVGSAFGASGTPSAVLVDAKGNIASDVAVGAQAVLALAQGDKSESAKTISI